MNIEMVCLMVVIVIIFAIYSHYSFKCNHKWEVVDKTILPSVAEVVRESGYSSKNAGPEEFVRKFRLTLVCRSCGKIHTRLDKSGYY